MKEEKIFKKVFFGGFDQKDVIDYLKEVNIVTTKKLEKVRKLEKENSSLKEELEDIERDYNELEIENEHLKKELDELKEAKQKKTEDSAKKQIKISNAENKLNDFMIESLAYSEKCIENARNVTRSVSKETLTQVEKVKKSIAAVNDEFNTLSSGLEKCMGEAKNRLTNLDGSLQKVCDSFQSEISSIMTAPAQKITVKYKSENDNETDEKKE